MDALTKIRIVGGLGAAFIVYSIAMGRMKTSLPDGYRNPVLALELVKDGSHIEVIRQAELGKAASFIRKSTYKDFGFIVVYALFFVSLSLALGRISGNSFLRTSAWFAACFAVLAAILDFVEDWAMLRALDGDETDIAANDIRFPSLGKWAALFAFAGDVGLLLIARDDLLAIPGVILLAAAATGITGVIDNLLQPKFYRTFPVALGLIGLAMILVVITFIAWPAKVLSGVSFRS